MIGARGVLKHSEPLVGYATAHRSLANLFLNALVTSAAGLDSASMQTSCTKVGVTRVQKRA